MRYSDSIVKIKINIYNAGSYICSELNIQISWNLLNSTDFDFKNVYNFRIHKLDNNKNHQIDITPENNNEYYQIRNNLYNVVEKVTYKQLNSLQVSNNSIEFKNISIGDSKNILSIYKCVNNKCGYLLDTESDKQSTLLKIQRCYDNIHGYDITLDYTDETNIDEVISFLKNLLLNNKKGGSKFNNNTLHYIRNHDDDLYIKWTKLIIDYINKYNE